MQDVFVQQRASDQQYALAKLEMVSSITIGKYLTELLINHILSAMKSVWEQNCEFRILR